MSCLERNHKLFTTDFKANFLSLGNWYLKLVRGTLSDKFLSFHPWVSLTITTAMQIYINKDGQQYGPYTVEQLQQYVQQGHFTPQDYACHDGQNWITVEQVPGFAGGGQAAAAQPQAQQAAQQPAQAQAAAQPQQAAC